LTMFRVVSTIRLICTGVTGSIFTAETRL
jgi:hypothetical protein